MADKARVIPLHLFSYRAAASGFWTVGRGHRQGRAHADARELLHGRSARAERSPGGMLKSQSLGEKQDPSGAGSVGQSSKR